MKYNVSIINIGTYVILLILLWLCTYIGAKNNFIGNEAASNATTLTLTIGEGIDAKEVQNLSLAIKIGKYIYAHMHVII